MLLRSKLFLSCLVLVVLLIFSLAVSVEASPAVWSQTYGGTEEDWASLVVTSDGGYAIVGTTRSYGAGVEEFWLVKTDVFGNVLLNKTYGGQSSDIAYSLVEASDGGYVLAGYTTSFEVTYADYMLVKTNERGFVEWIKTYGGRGWDKAYSVVATSDGGYALAGYTESFGAGGVDFWLVKTDSSGKMEWDKTYGGAGWEMASSLIATSDGGYALAGYTESFGAGGQDFWLVKTDGSGNMEWNQTYGGTGNDGASSLVETSDGGYAIAGSTHSFGNGYSDFWLVKTNGAGNMEWHQTYGGTSDDTVSSLIETSDEGYALAGNTRSGNTGDSDFWLVKTDEFGNMEWHQIHGGTESDGASSLVETTDGKYVLAGSTASFGSGGYDFWLVKTNPGENVEWSRKYGGPDRDRASSLVESSDGGYALAGYTLSFGAGKADFWLIKTDEFGNMEWSKTYGGTELDLAYSVVETFDGGYALTGYTDSFGAGSEDFWLVKTDASGNMEWSKTYGGTKRDWAYSLIATSDGGYALAGYTNSFDVENPDFWLVKTDASGNMEWNKTYEGPDFEYAYSLIATSDGGYALAGSTFYFGFGGYDVWLVKTDASGEMEWSRTYGGISEEHAYSVVETSDGGYAIAGERRNINPDESDFWLIKTDEFGNMEWNKTYGGIGDERASSLVETSDGGYILAGGSLLVKTDGAGNMEWNRTYGGIFHESVSALIATSDGGYAIAGSIDYFDAGGEDFWLVKTDQYCVPEFSSWVLPPLLLIATLVIVIYKKKLFQVHERIEQ